jgi:periplasmic divalent cation tolerance protein
MMKMSQHLMVLTTANDEEFVRRLSRKLVERSLAACVQVVGPISSTYRWKGSVESDREWLCLIKTRQELYSQVESAIREIHPYEVPEIVGLPISQGSRSYLSWLDDSVS